MRWYAIFLTLLSSFFIGCEKDKAVEITQESYLIPGEQFFPEGIAYDPEEGAFYTGSTTNGDVVKVNVKTGATELFAGGAKQGRGFCTGMKLDSRDRLWVCGGEEGKIHLLNAEGESVKNWDLKAQFNAGFINDCALDKKYIYFTDSRVQKIYRSTFSNAEPSDIEEWLSFTDQQIPYAAGVNANGIVLTPDGKYIIIVVSTSGKLYRIDRTAKSIVEINLNTPVTAGDGLLLTGNKLYVSRNSTNKIFPVTMNENYSQGIVGDGFGENLLFNTTIAKAGNYLLVVNGQLNRRPSATNPNPPPPVLPFTVSRVLIP
ncbi:MAG: SMP-30/gluconolactonase/LRE family protein [Chitinophagaceae bacterium]|nr:SMP-30/gluconolactonase/LRE family protein [Chitinophagaceae bacterium]